MDERSLRTDDRAEAIIRHYSDMVYRLAFSNMRNKSDAEDIYQEVFYRFIRKKPQFSSEEHSKAWFIRVTVNCCKKWAAASFRRKSQPLDESLVFNTREENQLFWVLEKLPMKYRAVIHLFYYEDLSIDAISKALCQKPSAIRTRLTRARSRLKEILKEDDYV